MTPERMQRRLADWAWRADPPDYPADLNAVHELEVRLSEAEWRQYYCCVQAVVARVVIHRPGDAYWIHASALQRCEALCRTLDLWEAQ